MTRFILPLNSYLVAKKGVDEGRLPSTRRADQNEELILTSGIFIGL
jgi:hypothetical protein